MLPVLAYLNRQPQDHKAPQLQLMLMVMSVVCPGPHSLRLSLAQQKAVGDRSACVASAALSAIRQAPQLI
jgi:hypothetical protein